MEHWDYDTARLETACEGRFQDVTNGTDTDRRLHWAQHRAQVRPRMDRISWMIGSLAGSASLAAGLAAWAFH
jgi:hypothetical protein